MAENYTPNNVTSFVNDTTAVVTVNNNFAAISSAFTDVLSRSGVSPNQMQSNLDMNNHQIINLPPPSTASSPARLMDLSGSITINTATTGTSGHAVPFLDGTNTWSGVQSFNAGIIETLSNPGSFIISNDFNSIAVATDNLDASGVGNVANAFNIFYGFGGSSTKGSRQGLLVNTQLTTATSATNTNRSYVAGSFNCEAVSSDGGGSGTEKGSIFACNPHAILDAAATHMSACVGQETDISCIAGSSVLDKYGMSIVQISNDAVSGSRNDAALSFANQAGSVGWKFGIQFGDNLNQFPVKSSGTLIKGNTGSTTTGIDFIATTFSGNPIQTNGFSVSNVGSISLGGGGVSQGLITLFGSVSGNMFMQTSNTATLLTISQPVQIGQIGTTGGTLTLAGLTSGSGILSVSSTGGTLQTSANLAVNGTISAGTNSGTGGQVTLNGSTSGSVSLSTPAASGGLLQFASSGSFSANGAVATALTSVGPTGSHTTVQTWLTIVDNTGATRYIPCF